MIRALLVALLVANSAHAGPWFDGTPEYADNQSRELAAQMLAAHGGMAPMQMAESLRFEFFTKALGGPTPFYSIEAVNLDNGDAYLEWPFWDSRIGFKDGELWSYRWPMPMPAGFFIRLTASFITLPWQIRADTANVGPVSSGMLPDDDTEYDVLRVTFDYRSPSIPGTYYDIYIDRETRLMKGIGFDINHPGMVANPKQPTGPNFHVFGEYRQFDGLVLPTFYLTYGAGSAEGGENNAYHFAWNVRVDLPFDEAKLEAPASSQRDAVSMSWWNSLREDTGVRR